MIAVSGLGEEFKVPPSNPPMMQDYDPRYYTKEEIYADSGYEHWVADIEALGEEEECTT